MGRETSADDSGSSSEGASEVVVCFGTPRKLPKAGHLQGRVVVLDIAFASESGGRRSSFERNTRKFIEALGDRLVAWVDHHDSQYHALYVDDPRFVLATKAQHGACPEMLSPRLVQELGPADTIVCHTDFDGLAAAAKWIRGGIEPYPGCDADARMIDTRLGTPSVRAQRLDRAIRARPKDEDLRRMIVRHLVAGLRDEAIGKHIDQVAQELDLREREAERLAEGYRELSDELVLVDATDRRGAYDRTKLLLLGQQRARMAVVIDDETVTFAAAFDSGVNFLECFGISGGMPTLVSVHRTKLEQKLHALGVRLPEDLRHYES